MPKPKPVNAEDVVYTHVRCGVADRGLVFYGYKSPQVAIKAALSHYRKEMERIQAQIETLEANKAVRVNYTKGGKYISAGDAMLKAGHGPEATAIIDAGK